MNFIPNPLIGSLPVHGKKTVQTQDVSLSYNNTSAEMSHYLGLRNYSATLSIYIWNMFVGYWYMFTRFVSVLVIYPQTPMYSIHIVEQLCTYLTVSFTLLTGLVRPRSLVSVWGRHSPLSASTSVLIYSYYHLNPSSPIVPSLSLPTSSEIQPCGIWIMFSRRSLSLSHSEQSHIRAVCRTVRSNISPPRPILKDPQCMLCFPPPFHSIAINNIFGCVFTNAMKYNFFKRHSNTFLHYQIKPK